MTLGGCQGRKKKSGLAQLMIVLIGILAFIRYQAMIPFLFALLLSERVCRRLILMIQPILPSGARLPGIFINIALVSLTIIGFILYK